MRRAAWLVAPSAALILLLTVPSASAVTVEVIGIEQPGMLQVEQPARFDVALRISCDRPLLLDQDTLLTFIQGPDLHQVGASHTMIDPRQCTPLAPVHTTANVQAFAYWGARPGQANPFTVVADLRASDETTADTGAQSDPFAGHFDVAPTGGIEARAIDQAISGKGAVPARIGMQANGPSTIVVSVHPADPEYADWIATTVIELQPGPAGLAADNLTLEVQAPRIGWSTATPTLLAEAYQGNQIYDTHQFKVTLTNSSNILSAGAAASALAVAAVAVWRLTRKTDP